MKFMVAHDSSEQADKALDLAFKLMRAENDELIVISIPQIYHRDLITSIQVDFDYQILDSANARICEQTKKNLEQIAERARAANIKVTTLIEEGAPREKICELAEHHKVDMLFMGSRGLSKIKTMVIGSVSDYVSKHAHCAVTIVH